MIKCYRGNELPENAKASENAKSYGCDACEFMHNNELIRCSKFIGLSGKNPQSEEEFSDTFRCVETWVPILMIENSKQGLSTTVAVESARNTINESISTVNTNLKNSMEALSNANVMSRLEQKTREVIQQPIRAVDSNVVNQGTTDIYGN